MARLAQLPDDDEDGGIESTLLKLEGRFERRSSEEDDGWDEDGEDDSLTPTTRRTITESDLRPDSHVVDLPPSHRPHRSTATPGPSLSARPPAAKAAHEPKQRSSTAEGEAIPKEPYVHAIFAASIIDSDHSYSSTPILERGLSNKSLEGRRTRGTRSTVSLARPGLAHHQGRSAPNLKSPRTSREPAKDGNHLRVTPPRTASPHGSIAQASFLLDDEDDAPESFLLDDDQDLSDLSSELSTADETQPPNGGDTLTSSLFPRGTSGAVISEIGVPFHPLRHPPSPPPSADRVTSTPAGLPPVRMHRRSPSPGPSPVEPRDTSDVASASQAWPLPGQPSEAPPAGPTVPNRGSRHLPFILEHRAELLAQQLTLLEKDALNEIDWKELVDLRSNQSSFDTRNWFKFLQSDDAKGVGLVIARFNVMVKWALSELVLTQDIEERARCISKYIHIASHARRLRNFATTYQIMTALLSTDCSRLKQTWQLVPRADVEMAKELEKLVQPVRNFHQLRIEMETATVEDGCIPFECESRHRTGRPSRDIDS